MCKNCKEESRDGCTLASFYWTTVFLANNFYCTQILLELHLSLIIILLVYQEVRSCNKVNEGKIGKTQPDIRSMSHLFFRRHKQTL